MMLLSLLGAGVAGEVFAQIATTIFSFLLFMAILVRFAFRPVREVLDDRRDSIARQFEEIEKKQAETAARLKEYEERLRNIDEEGRQHIAKAIDEGRAVATQLLDAARKDAEEITAKARAAMKLEIDQARIELRNTMVGFTIQATEKLLHEKLDDEHHRQLVGTFISDLEKRKAS